MIGAPPDVPGFVPSGLDLTLPGEQRVAIAGDWHGNIRWIQTALPRLHRAAPDVRTVLQLGDFGYWPTGDRPGKGFLAACDYWAKSAGIERIMFLPGNHEQWDWLLHVFATHPGAMAQVTQRVWAMPRGFRFTLGGREFMAFGGAASHDLEWRTEGVSWFPEEMPTQEEADVAASGRKVDILLAHDARNPASPAIRKLITDGIYEHDVNSQQRSALSRRRVIQVYEYHRPRQFYDGHFHLPAVDVLAGETVYSLGMDGQQQNVGVLDLDTLKFDSLTTSGNSQANGVLLAQNI